MMGVDESRRGDLKRLAEKRGERVAGAGAGPVANNSKTSAGGIEHGPCVFASQLQPACGQPSLNGILLCNQPSWRRMHGLLLYCYIGIDAL